jgi:hypothetical protein
MLLRLWSSTQIRAGQRHQRESSLFTLPTSSVRPIFTIAGLICMDMLAMLRVVSWASTFARVSIGFFYVYVFSSGFSSGFPSGFPSEFPTNLFTWKLFLIRDL